jgi:hypothetical protein
MIETVVDGLSINHFVSATYKTSLEAVELAP